MALKSFLKGNKKTTETIKYVASMGFVDEKGNPEEWTIKTITSKEDEAIRTECMRKVPIPGRKSQFTSELNTNAYLGKLAARCIVEPNLNDKDLQDSYGVFGADEVLKEMLSPGEYNDLLMKIQEINGFDVTMQDKVDEVKN